MMDEWPAAGGLSSVRKKRREESQRSCRGSSSERGSTICQGESFERRERRSDVGGDGEGFAEMGGAIMLRLQYVVEN